MTWVYLGICNCFILIALLHDESKSSEVWQTLKFYWETDQQKEHKVALQNLVHFKVTG